MTSEQGGDGFGDLAGLLAQAQEMQQQLLDAREAVAAQEVEGHAGGGAVKVRCTGGLEFERVTIDPAAVDPSDVAMLEDLVLAAIRDAVARANALNQEALGGFAGGLGGLLP
ncbi:MAG TPA: YbaB/EbfC family nucleoid-associated protein [Acidimicrobiales bacterium]|nr:YbaB/EbfC family nucleoid-associated protein [Acidimicrobiales bacterium]